MEQLAELVKQGDRQAMQQLYRLTLRYMTAVVRRYVDDEEDVKDVLQESYLKVFAGIGQFEPRGEGSLRGWMTRIAVNEALLVLRRRVRWDWIEHRDDLPDVVDDATLETEGIPIGEWHRMIRRLPPGYRTVFNLYVVEGKSHREIGQMLGIKERTSSSQLYHAKQMLRTWAEEYYRRQR